MSEQFNVTADPERIAQLIAHRACCGTEHDPANGKLHGYCVVCGVPWPCEYAGAPQASADPGLKEEAFHGMVARFLTWPLPEDVRADPCAISPGPGRTGTSLLTYSQAEAMLRHVLAFRP